MAGGQRLRLSIPQPTTDLVLVFEEQGIDLVVERSDLGADAVANLPGRRWGRQVLTAWDLPAESEFLHLRPLLANAPRGTYRYAWHRLAAGDQVSRAALQSLSRAADVAPGRDAQSTQAALELLQRAVEVNAVLIDKAEIWFRIGQLHARAGNVDAAQQAYEASLSALDGRADNDLGLAHVLAASSMNLMRAGRLGEAAKLNARAAVAAQRAGDLYQQALISNNGCVIVRAGGDMKAAAACFGEALIDYQQAGLIEHQSAVLTNLSAAYTSLGQGHAALDALQQAILLRDGAAGDDDALAQVAALTHLAQTQARLGRYQHALASGQQALTQAQALGNAFWVVQVGRILAQTHVELGQPRRARLLLESISEQSRNGSSGALRLELAAALLDESKPGRATRLLALQRRAEASGDELSVARAQLHWSAASADLAPVSARVEALRGALALAERHGLVALQIEASLSLSELVEEGEAERLLATAEAQAGAAQLPLEQHALYYAQARRARDSGDWNRARERVLAADRLENRLSLQMSPQQRHEFQRQQTDRQQFAVGLVAAETSGLSDAERANWVLQRLLRSRAQLWRQQTRERMLSERVEYRLALEELSFLASQGRGEEPSAGTDGVALEAAIAKVEALERSVSQLREPLSLAQLQRQLGPTDRLILLATGEPDSLAVVVAKDDIQLVGLAPADTVAAALDGVLAGLSRQDPLGQKALARRIQGLTELLAPAFAGRSYSRAYLLSDPVLDALPVEVLAGADSRVQQPLPTYLRWGIASAGGWFPASQLKGVPAEEFVLLYDGSMSSGQPAGLAALPNAALEVTNIAATVGAADPLQLSGEQAADWLTDPRPRRVGVVHVAAHAVNDQLLGASSILALAGDRAEGRVNLGALQPQSVMADLTVLSGCSTGVGARGDYRQGFAEAFIGAGSRQVLATLWPVDDEASAAFMGEFYRRLWADQARSPEQALAQTKHQFATSGRWRDPYWWAGYQLWSADLSAAQISEGIARTR